MPASVVICLLLGCFLYLDQGVSSVQAASSAYDDVTDFAYSDGWQSGDNGGFGFDPWSGSGLIISSLSNDFGTATVGIDTGGASWALPANAVGITRTLSGASLAVGYTFTVDLLFGFNAGRGNAFDLLADLEPRFSFAVDNSGGPLQFVVRDSGIFYPGFVNDGNGLRLAIQLTDADHYVLTLTNLGTGQTGVFNREFATVPSEGQPITGFRFLNYVSGSPAVYSSLFFNSLEVVAIPEPNAFWLVTLPALLLLCGRRRTH